LLDEESEEEEEEALAADNLRLRKTAEWPESWRKRAKQITSSRRGTEMARRITLRLLDNRRRSLSPESLAIFGMTKEGAATALSLHQ